MRFVRRRREAVPALLTSDTARAARAEIERFLVREDAELRQRRAPFDFKLIQAGEVRSALLNTFVGKCAFCESELLPMSQAEVVHFRPRQTVEREGLYNQRHYAWLSYDWENLYPACLECNRNKEDRFPVNGLRAPLFSTVSEARSYEEARLVDPCFDDPRLHLAFRFDGLCEPKTPTGSDTIELYQLNRTDLVDSRMHWAEKCFSLLPGQHLDSNATILRDVLSPKAPYLGAMTHLFALVVERLSGVPARWPRTGVPPSKMVRFLQPFSVDAIQDAIARLQSEQSSRVPATAPVWDEPILQTAVGEAARRAIRSRPSFIHLKNFGGVENVKLSVPELKGQYGRAGALMLLGENGTGKSSVLQAIALTLLGTRQASRLTDPEDLLRRKGNDRFLLLDTEPLEVEVGFYSKTEPAILKVDPLARHFEGEPTPVAVVVGYAPRRYAVDGKVSRSNSPYARVNSLFKPDVAIPDPKPWLFDLRARDQEQFFAVARALREVMALHTNDSLVVDKDLGVCVEVQGRKTPITRLSEGYKALFVMAVDIMRELLDHFPNLEVAQGVVLIDEIETHLHPRWKLRIMSALRNAMPRVTFIATTHDPLCLRGMEDGEIVVLFRDSNNRVQQHTDLPSVKGMRAEQFLTSDYFGLNSTADPETEERLLKYVAALGRKVDATGSVDLPDLGDMESDLSRTLVLGDTAADQIVQEALAQYLAEREDRASPELTEAREKVVSRVLAALRAPLES